MLSTLNNSQQSVRKTKTMKLIYRALIFDYTPAAVKPYVKPRALNWRFQPPGQKFECTPCPILPYVKPKAMNWRFQLAANINQFE